ncbi:hypothetical protein GGR61_001481, partial [Xanthomonas arboricola]|nr:hypothetical protein [Xanthomonas sp. 3058]
MLLLLLRLHRLLGRLLFLLVHRLDGLGAQHAAGWFIGQDLRHLPELIAVAILRGGQHAVQECVRVVTQGWRLVGRCPRLLRLRLHRHMPLLRRMAALALLLQLLHLLLPALRIGLTTPFPRFQWTAQVIDSIPDKAIYPSRVKRQACAQR